MVSFNVASGNLRSFRTLVCTPYTRRCVFLNTLLSTAVAGRKIKPEDGRSPFLDEPNDDTRGAQKDHSLRKPNHRHVNLRVLIHFQGDEAREAALGVDDVLQDAQAMTSG